MISESSTPSATRLDHGKHALCGEPKPSSATRMRFGGTTGVMPAGTRSTEPRTPPTTCLRGRAKPYVTGAPCAATTQHK